MIVGGILTFLGLVNTIVMGEEIWMSHVLFIRLIAYLYSGRTWTSVIDHCSKKLLVKAQKSSLKRPDSYILISTCQIEVNIKH
ncbi:MAG: hypothetical protein IPP27_13990 [Bacteroidetes bacterium]|nr:hypothetical protein [Bacteroidota bacterium]